MEIHHQNVHQMPILLHELLAVHQLHHLAELERIHNQQYRSKTHVPQIVIVS